jgi:hypothetical protein
MTSMEMTIIEPDLHIDSTDRNVRANYFHTEAVKYGFSFIYGWLGLAKALAPIREERLYKELGYATWSEYTNQVFGKPPQTIDTSIRRFTMLKAAGLDPEQFADFLPSRVEELARIAVATGGHLEPELIEKARDTSKKGEFKVAVRKAKSQLHIEQPIKLEVIMPESLHRQFSVCMEILRILRQDGEIKAADLIGENLADFVLRPDVRALLETRPDLFQKLKGE